MNDTASDTKQDVIRRCEAAYADGVGIKLKWHELGLLMGTPVKLSPPPPGKRTQIPVRMGVVRLQYDMHRVRLIEEAAFEEPWTDADFYNAENHADMRSIAGFVDNEGGTEMAGFLYYRQNPRHRAARILNIAVSPEYARRGVGTQMVARMMQSFGTIHIDVSLKTLGVCLFLKSMGFIAEGPSDPGLFVFEEGDGVAFIYRAGREV